MTKGEAFKTAVDMLMQFAEEQNIIIMGTLVMDDPNGDLYIEQINSE